MFIFLFNVEEQFLPIYILNILTSIIFFLVLNSQLAKSEKYYTEKRLVLLVFIYSFISVAIYNIISYYYRGNLFVFSEADALFYDRESRIMAGMSFSDGIKNYLNNMLLEDLGAVLVISSLYRIIESNLLLNFVYIIIGAFTALCIFRISKKFMSIKYAFLCALTYSVSSFVLWYHASGLKESFMVMLVVVFFDQFYQFYINKKYIAVLYCIISLLALLLFRPVIVFLCIGALSIGVLLSKKVNTFSLVILVLFFIITIYLSNYISTESSRFIYNSNDELIDIKEKSGMVKGGVLFTYITNIVAATIGPMPTLQPNEKIILSLFSPGLIFRVLIGAVLWFGVFYIIKTREGDIFPLVLFYLLEAASLVYIMESLELRKSLPHFPMIYIISFWFLDKYNNLNHLNSNVKQRIRIIINLSSFLFALLIIYWNYR
ncbi:hypothetical protein CYCD_08470 [Tenuifilaceae bacterium CYCD]|nr:hypothetical protein CYCD_08470 [Tenuifilaceae bacterium CYCD]